jgi:uncharacterized integral membrane protein
MTRFKFYIGFLIFIVLVIFAIQNPIVVDIKLFTWEIRNCPLSLLTAIPLFIAMLLGFLFGWIKTMSFNTKYRRSMRAKDEEIDVYQGELRRYKDLMSEDDTPIGKLIVKKINKR